MRRCNRVLRTAVTIMLGALFTLVATVADAVVPSLVNYQGILKNASDVPQVGTFSVTFALYSTPSGGSPIWTETQSVTTDAEGVFNVLLGSNMTLTESAFSGSDRYLGTAVSPDGEMTPRTRIATVAYAFRPATVDGASGGTVTGNVTVAAGNVELGPSTPAGGNITKNGSLFIHDFGLDNTFVGLQAGNQTMSGYDNAAFGFGAFSNNTTGRENIAVGVGALYSNTDGNGNTGVGQNVLFSNTYGYENTALGQASLGGNVSGHENTAVGYFELENNSIGYDNTATGWNALSSNSNGSYNSAIGALSLLRNLTGANNTAIGVDALSYNTSGDYNTAVGLAALVRNTSGKYNTAIGYGADVVSDTFTNATALGSRARVDANNKVRIGDTAVTVIEGQVAYTFTSDKNQKENFQAVDGDAVLQSIREMSLMSWNYKGQDPRQFRHYGPVAQEFYAAFGNDGVGTSGTPTTINSGDEAGVLMVAVQALEKRNQELEATVVELQSQVRRISDELSTRPK